MRYLYGDSTPFPLGYNFLTTLESFMMASTRIVQLDLDGQVLIKRWDEVAQNRVKGLEALEQFHNVVMRAVQDTAQKVHHQHALEYARAVGEYATRYIEEHRRTTLASNERESLQIRGEGERRASEMRSHLEAFLKTARFPVLDTKLSLRLNAEGKETWYTGTAAFEHPDGISTAFTTAPSRTTAWATPRKLSDFAQGIDLKVGVEKSWLRGTITPKVLSVDDWTITHVEVGDESFDLVLRRRLTEKETLVFKLRREGAGVVAGTVEHPGVTGVEALPASLGAQDVSQIERIWMAVQPAMHETVERREQLLGISLDGQPVFDSGLVVPFVVRLVAMFAPTVREIAERSPNEFELTLKTEGEGGRREELYLRRDALVSTLQPLPAKGRELFAPLGLDHWVPSMTGAPPPLAVTEPAPHLSEAPLQASVVPPAPPSRTKH